VPYWAACQLQASRTRLAEHFLQLNGYEVYCPRIRTAHNGSALLFPAYAFVSIELQWRAAARAPGVLRIVLNGNGEHPARVPDGVIADLRGREGPDGLIELPAAPRPRELRPGDRLRIIKGPFQDKLPLFQGVKPRQRVEVLLQLLGGERHLVVARSAVMPAP
jgi:transcriptional antiterminator RfaH